MIIENLPDNKRDLCQRILRGEEEAKYKPIENETLRKFLEERDQRDLKFEHLLFPDGTVSGLARCELCAERQLRLHGHTWFLCSVKANSKLKVSLIKIHVEIHHSEGENKRNGRKRRMLDESNPIVIPIV